LGGFSCKTASRLVCKKVLFHEERTRLRGDTRISFPGTYCGNFRPSQARILLPLGDYFWRNIMASLNKASLIGNLGADPEIRYTAAGVAVANFPVATNESWTTAEGAKKSATEWHRVVLYKKLAEIAGQYLKKGAQVYIEGRIKTRKWEDKDGGTHYTTEIQGYELKMLGKASDNEVPQGKSNEPPAPAVSAVPSGSSDLDDDIPF
jgi:single-strand DNA-binding protein